MEYLKQLFRFTDKITIQENYSSNFQAPIKVIEEQLKLFEGINLSPLPQTKDDQDLLLKQISESMIKIIYFLDIIVLERMKETNIVDVKTSKREKYSDHYWKFITKYFSNTDSVKYITNIKEDSLSSLKEKGLCYLTILIMEKTFNVFVKQFYNQEFEK